MSNNSYNVYFIEGQKDSVCRNNAFSVVKDGQLLDIIPAEDLKKKNLSAHDLKEAFTAAGKTTSNTERLKTLARRKLGL